MENRLPEGYLDRAPRLEDTEALVEMFNAASQEAVGCRAGDGGGAAHRVRVARTQPGGGFSGGGGAGWDDGGLYRGVWAARRHSPRCTAGGGCIPSTWGAGWAHTCWNGRRGGRARRCRSPHRSCAWRFGLFATRSTPRLRHCSPTRAFKLVRHNLRMVIELDGAPPEPVWPEGIMVRTVVPGQDEYRCLCRRAGGF